MLIRRATESDIPAIVRFRGLLWDSFLDHVRIADVPDWTERASASLHDLLPRDTHAFLVADVDGAVVGAVSASLIKHLPGPHWSGISATIQDMWVEPEARGRRVASALMSEVLAWLREVGAEQVTFYSTPMAVPAYLKMGFRFKEPEPWEGEFPKMTIDL